MKIYNSRSILHKKHIRKCLKLVGVTCVLDHQVESPKQDATSVLRPMSSSSNISLRKLCKILMMYFIFILCYANKDNFKVAYFISVFLMGYPRTPCNGCKVRVTIPGLNQIINAINDIVLK